MPPRKAGKQVAKQEDEGNGGRAAEVPQTLAPFMEATADTQATTIEWVRAAAEVRAAVMVAREFPRNLDRAVDDLRRACRQIEMARRAFYTYRRGNSVITGPTVQLAREAMRCWGNFQASMWELARHPGWSEMMVWAWDLESNARFASTFRVVHVRERGADKGGSYLLEEEEVRDIYELNTNMAARRLREQIKAGLPAWFMAVAEAECKKTMTQLGDEDDEAAFRVQVDNCVKAYASGKRFSPVPEAALERKVGVPREAWTTNDLLTLRVLYEALSAGELRPGGEFPELAQPEGGSADEALAKAAAAKAGDGEQEAKAAPKEEPAPPPVSSADKPPRPPAGANRTTPDPPARPRRQAPAQEPRSAGDAWDQAGPLGGGDG